MYKSAIFFLAVLCLLPVVYLFYLLLAGNLSYPYLLSFDSSVISVLASIRLSGLFNSFITSVAISMSVSTTATFLGFFSSFAIAKSAHRKSLLIFSYFPFVLSPVIYAVLVSHYFILFGLNASIFGVILVHLLFAFPFAVILFESFWNERIISIVEVSKTLGSGTLDLYLKVLIPLARGIFALVFFQCFLVSWFEFGMTSLIGTGKVQTLPVAVFSFVQEADIRMAALASLLLCLPPMTLLWINKRFLVTKFTID